MKTKLFAALALVALSPITLADNVLPYPGPEAKQGTDKLFRPGYCEVEIQNNSGYYAQVHATYDTGATQDFPINAGERWRLPMYYGYKCHRGLDIDIYGPFGYVGSNYVYTDQLLVIDPYFKKQAKLHLVQK